MKKFYLSVLAAAVAVTACDKSETINLQENKQQEVAFSPISMPATKAPISTTAFPDDNTIYVSASNASGATKKKFFEAKEKTAIRTSRATRMPYSSRKTTKLLFFWASSINPYFFGGICLLFSYDITLCEW